MIIFKDIGNDQKKPIMYTGLDVYHAPNYFKKLINIGIWWLLILCHLTFKTNTRDLPFRFW